MDTLQRLAAITAATDKLVAQLRELNELRDQVRKAELSARRSRPISRTKKTVNSEKSATTSIREWQQQMSDEVSPPFRFLVRKGCKG